MIQVNSGYELLVNTVEYQVIKVLHIIVVNTLSHIIQYIFKPLIRL